MDAPRPTSTIPLRTGSGWPLLGVLAAVLVPYLLLVARFDFLNDDAFISFRYARHLAEGHGLRFNVGSDPPVEGYSNFLWVVWLGGLAALGLDIPQCSRLSAIACGVALLVSFTLFLRRRFGLRPAPLCAAGLVLATLPSMTLWSTSGLATMPTALFVFLTFERLLGDPGRPRGVQAGVAGALAALLRADGVGYVGLVGIAALLSWFRTRDRRLLAAVAVVAGIVTTAVVGLVAWRFAYYGELVPNTAHLKAGFSADRLGRGANYVVLNLLTVPSLALCVLAGLVALLGRPRTLTVAALLVVVGTLSYAVYVGGDFLPLGRLLIPAVPFAVLLLVSFQERWIPDSFQRLVISGALVALSLLSTWDLHVVPRSALERFAFRYTEAQFETELENWEKVKNFTTWWTDLGKSLALHTRPGESIVLYNVGCVGYYCDLVIYDMYGLTHREAARAAEIVPHASPGHDMRIPWDFFLSYEPTYISAVIVPKGKPIDLSYLAARSPLFETVQIERHELFPENGSLPNTELVLGRIVRN